MSDVLGIKYGVPQGSVLGPLLFLVYINDIHNSVIDANVKLFADDTNLFVHAKDLNSAIDKSNKCIDELSDWLIANKLSLSIDKTMFTVFGCSDSSHVRITVAGNVVKQVSSCKYLGVYIDQDLKWTVHIDYVYKNLLKYIGIFYKLRKNFRVNV